MDTIASIDIGTSYHSNVTVHHLQRYLTGAAGITVSTLRLVTLDPSWGRPLDGQMVRSPAPAGQPPGPAASGWARAERTTPHDHQD